MSEDLKYRRVADALREEVTSLAPNTLLPTEEQLARRFGVSRVTIRQSLGLLERAGLISRQRGRGTTVSPPKITRHLSPLYTFDDDLRQQGVKFETRVVGREDDATPPEAIRSRLGLGAGQTAHFLSLVRLVDGRIICHDRRYFPAALVLALDPLLVTNRPVSDVLVEMLGKPITAVDWETEIVPASPAVASSLGITPGVLIVANSFTEYLSDAAPVQAGVMSYRIDRVKFKFAAPGAYSEPERT